MIRISIQKLCFLNVLNIEIAPPLPRKTIASVYLRPACDARFHLQPLMIFCSIVIQSIGNIRARTDQAHLSANDIDQLR